MMQVTGVRLVRDRVLRLTFSDGSERDVDLRDLMRGPLFAQIAADDAAFAEVRVDLGSGTICWSNGADLDPDVLHGDYAPSWTGNSVIA